MIKYILFLFLFFTFAVFADSAFLADQKKFGRVMSAYREKRDTVSSILKKADIEQDKLNIMIVSFKHEMRLDVYGRNAGHQTSAETFSFTENASR